ncbi:MAG TPA: hypothetical protein PKN56_22830 [Leptospiraceae bacterium]|nr:hypothetical protein [Leptospiraceae bacterium]HMY67528.1 hypothetical protein [Leptospiraceae bacterium]HNH07387.1 hypothetical protein [Leptospiraceae bacterium]HNI95976.1 hypothetical protein [Leptospiraceae bacterium]HNM01887.1 hypothetical protein [Leptospiraceae bacterium]
MKFLKILILALAGFNTVSCVYSQARILGPTNQQTQYILTSEDFKILGPVEAEGEYMAILGMVGLGGNGYDILQKKAQQMGGDDIMNFQVDLEGTAVLLIVYDKAKWRARAMAVKYTDKVKARQ